MINALGKTVEASIPNAVAAIQGVQLDDTLMAFIVNKDYKGCKKAEKLVSSMKWALTNGTACGRSLKAKSLRQSEALGCTR